MANTPVKALGLVTLSSGIEVRVETLSPMAIQAINNAAEKAHPLPDKDAFQVVVQDAYEEGDTTLDEDAYREALEVCKQARNDFLMDWLIDNCVSHEDESAVIEANAAHLEKIEALGAAMPENRFIATLRYVLLSKADVNNIFYAATRMAPLTSEEVLDAVAYFRLGVGRHTRAANADRKAAPVAGQ